MIELEVLERGALRRCRLNESAVEAFEASLLARGGLVLARRSTAPRWVRLQRRPPPEHWAAWFSALSRTLGGGVPLDRSLELLADAAPDPGRAQRIHREVVGGQRFSASVAIHLPGLPDLIPALLRTGEAAGDLARGTALARQSLLDRAAFRRELKARLSYPFVVVCAATLALAVLLTKVFPALGVMWTNLGQPLPTRLELLRWGGWVAVAGLGLLAAGLAWIMGGGEGAQRLPGFRRLGQHRVRAEAWSALAMALGGGVGLVDSLALLGARWGAQDLRAAVQMGQRPERVLEAWLDDAPGLRAVLLAALRVGDLAGGAKAVAEGYREMLEADLQRLQRWLEPAILGVLGGVLMGLAWSLFALMGEMEHGLVR